MSSEKELNGLDNYGYVNENESTHDASTLENGNRRPHSSKKNADNMLYLVTDNPPWYLCILLGTQHYLTALGGMVAIPLLLSRELCLQHDHLTQSKLISTIFFVSGMCTLLQVLFGVRTTSFIVIFSQYLRNVSVPIPSFSRRKRCHFNWLNIFQMFPVLFGIVASWVISFLLTHFNVFPNDPNAYGYYARTDIKSDVISRAEWFRIPYPGQWGLPTVSLAGTFGILAGVISSMIESVGDYHACARLCGAPLPPREAINRGIGIEGIGCLLAGAWGTGNGTTSYSENVGALGITKVGSRIVILTSGLLMICVGMLVKIGAIFSTIPPPVIGGMLMVMFSIITAVGISNLQFVDMNSSRNIFIFGFSTFAGLAVPNWLNQHPDSIQTGVVPVDQVIRVLLTTSMFVGGFLGFFLDNTIPGSEKERGIVTWKQSLCADGDKAATESDCYNLPFGIGFRCCTGAWTRYIPFCPKLKPTEKEEKEVNTVIHNETQL
ncbi:xan_ur_permease domain-containing protein isoform X2 [Mobula hypostoma]|uniref:xan_ur_permease domain-containing protein isoform X2 n=1 Tax=Mobula hypostoma TaxID=723540 RepID=UPI002FC3CD01